MYKTNSFSSPKKSIMGTNYTTKSKLIDSPILPLNTKELFTGTAKSQFYKDNRE